MLNFFISLVVFAVSTFLLAVSIRYGMIGAARLDQWLMYKSRNNVDGFDWYYRIPFSVGIIPEYFYAMVLGKKNYFKTNWWALKTASFLSVLLFIALLKSKTAVTDYYSLLFLGDKGITAFITSGVFVWYMNFITLSYLGLAILIGIESIKMAGRYAPIRIFYYGILALFMAFLTLAVLSVIILVSLIYLGYKLVKFLFFSKNIKFQEEEKSASEILNRGFSGFKPDLYEWESDRRNKIRFAQTKQKQRRKFKIKRRIITVNQKSKVTFHDEDIPRLHPD
jgi:hypothetical protein